MRQQEEAVYQPKPEEIWEEYRRAVAYKDSLGTYGLVEQGRINERFYCGDQWYGLDNSDNRPLVRHNVIKRIGDYKMAVVASAPVAVSFSAEGVPNTLEIRNKVASVREQLRRGESPTALTAQEEAQAVAGALTDYFATTARRLGLDTLGRQALRDAYITGTGVLYTYWDEHIRTGLYADVERRMPIDGDIACELLGIEHICVGDPTLEDIQQQPYILIEQQKPAVQVRQMAQQYGSEGWQRIRPDEGGDNLQKHTTVITRLWKERDAVTGQPTVWAVQVCRNATVRAAWNMGVRVYPLSFLRWEQKRCRAYGESEIPYLIPNQIAINRTVSAGVWAVMMMGMPIMLVDGDIVQQPVTNDPGQIITLYGDDAMSRAIQYVNPPAFSGQLDANVQSLISDTLAQAGINSTLLGDVKPNNASAILAVREASLMPLQIVQNRYFRFIEEVARIWCEFWLTMYGNRSLKIQQPDGVWYMPFHTEKYRDLLLAVTADVGAGSQYSEERTVETLDNLYKNGAITAKQYLSRLPQGYVPELESLLQELI